MPWTVAHQALLSMEFSRQQYWSCPSPGHLPNPGIEPCLLHCRWILYHLSSLQLFLWWAVGLCQTTTTMTTLSPKGTVWLPTEGTDAFLWEIHPTSPSMAQCQEAEVWSCVKLLYLGKNRKRPQFSQQKLHLAEYGSVLLSVDLETWFFTITPKSLEMKNGKIIHKGFPLP